MPEKKKEVKSCHDCGLEAIDDCETEKRHIPYDETLPPCRFCVRNSAKPLRAVTTDFYDEMWILESDKTPIIEDPDPHERELLRYLHEIDEIGSLIAFQTEIMCAVSRERGENVHRLSRLIGGENVAEIRQ